MKKATMAQTIRVGVSAIIVKDNKVLFGQRISKHGKHTWAPPGGHLEIGEDFSECTLREVREETGITVSNLCQGWITNDMFSKSKHYVTVHMLMQHQHGDVQRLEPEKHHDWQWFDWDQLPTPLFLPIQNLRDQGVTMELILQKLADNHSVFEKENANTPSF